jgi:hypothetical protein
VRRSVERFSATRCEDRGTSVVTALELTRELEEAIAALGRRVPRGEQAGEALIARSAAALRAQAVERLAELDRRTVRPSRSEDAT